MMSLTSKVIYSGDLRTNATHVKSNTSIITDAPTDNHGKGESFSPTDLVATALASCLLTIMGIRSRDMNVSIEGATAEIEKIMSSGPRRISEIVIVVTMPKNDFSDKDKIILEKAARTCPVALSIHPDTKQTIDFVW